MLHADTNLKDKTFKIAPKRKRVSKWYHNLLASATTDKNEPKKERKERRPFKFVLFLPGFSFSREPTTSHKRASEVFACGC